ncbi:MAG: 23S rRNA (adenine(2030)-N(6))-methyltransferase RlmJ [Opitutaceae bacterium]|nr:23S rRNA (adenine(2030)-N(6))-methyltransferase RlmJ [Opitutaceae bacterium]
MNYRHHFHAGNFADVFKHVLLLVLLRAMQRKEKGFLYLDTHAGRGGYDLGATMPGREPEWPGGIGRLWDAPDLPPALAGYVALVRQFDARHGPATGAPHHYPGSPWVAKQALRPQDRLVLTELRADDAEALAAEFAEQRRVSVQCLDGYTALKALLPPPERRALTLIDPPFESKTEYADILAGLREALRRFPGGVYAIWYPLTERARADEFLAALQAPPAPPALLAEFNVAGPDSELRLKGCGLLIINPPWQIEREFAVLLPALTDRLQTGAGASWRLEWLVPEAPA